MAYRIYTRLFLAYTNDVCGIGLILGIGTKEGVGCMRGLYWVCSDCMRVILFRSQG